MNLRASLRMNSSTSCSMTDAGRRHGGGLRVWQITFETTAHFLGWLAEQRGAQGLLVDVNASLVDDEWRDDWFDTRTGLSVETLWNVYKAQH
jgi:hypothetical protein